jgi:hypothetical protein
MKTPFHQILVPIVPNALLKRHPRLGGIRDINPPSHQLLMDMNRRRLPFNATGEF